MYSEWGVSWLDFVLLLGLSILTFLFWKQKKIIQSLLPKDKKSEGLIDKFREVLLEVESLQKREQLTNKNLKNYILDSLNHIQKFKLKRYNPYDDVGGDLSFTLSLLNGKNSGVLITSLHTRAGTRLYAKEIIAGKSELKLSKEEEVILQEVMDLT